MTPLVSIIIPTYNYAFCIAETIRSLQDQMYQNWEAIIVDDGSNDNSREEINRLSSDSRVKYFYQEKSGVSTARNRGINESKGKYIQFLDADDLLSSIKLSSQVELMESNSLTDIIYSTAFYFEDNCLSTLYKGFYKDQIEWIPKINGKGTAIVSLFIKKNIFPINSALIRASSIKDIRFDTTLTMMEDWFFWFECALNGMQFDYQDNNQSFALIRLHPNSASQNRKDMYKAVISLVTKLRSRIQHYPEFKKMSKLIDQAEKTAYKRYILHIGVGSLDKLADIYYEKGICFTFSCYLKALNEKIRS